MTAEYKASVAMLMPETGLTDQPNPTTWSLLAAPVDDLSKSPLLYGTVRRVTFLALTGQQSYDQTPATTAPAPTAVSGQELVLRGAGIHDTDEVFLVTVQPDGTEIEQDITSWKVPLIHPYPTAPTGGVPVALRPPDAPGVCPPPGRYLLRLGRPSDPGWRSNPVPLSIAPWLDPAPGPLLSADGSGLYTCAAVNVPSSGAEVRLGTALLKRRASGTPTFGEWRLAGTTLTFKAPKGLASGEHAVRIRAADVEADPALWAAVP
jgi:hypothetical protein